MNHTQFTKKRLWQKTDYDGVFQYQCVDLIKQYMKDVYAVEPGIFWGSAIIGYQSGSPFINAKDNFKKMTLSDSLPLKGDIIFRWPSGKNNYGHVAIVDEMVNTTKVRVIEQNGVWWWNGTGTNAIRLKEYPIKNTVWRYRYRPSLSNQEEIVIDLILHNNGKLYGITKDPWLKDLLAQTNQKIRNLYR